KAYQWTEYIIDHFYDGKSGLFYLTSDESEQLITRPIELSDNVISSSNSIFVRCLWQLGFYFEKPILKEISEIMLQTVLKDTIRNGSFYAEWSSLLWEQIHPFYEVTFTSETANHQVLELFSKQYHPQILVFGSDEISHSMIPSLKDKILPNIYVCQDHVCQA